MKLRLLLAGLCAAALAAFQGPAAAQLDSTSAVAAPTSPTKLTYYGHSAFRIITPLGHILYIDPWLENPRNLKGKEEVAAIHRADLILISHGHYDHVGDTPQIVAQTKAKIVSNFELAHALVKYANIPAERVSGETSGNVGGTLVFFNGEVRITYTPAIHSSSVNAKALGISDDDEDHAAGNPTGFIVAIRNGPTFYHTGDTALFGDLSQLQRYHVDVMMVCIGDHFTMGPQDAAKAVALVHAKSAIPMHFGTFPLLTGTPAQFQKALQAQGLGNVYHPMAIGETRTFSDL